METRRIKRIVVVFNTIVEIPFSYFYNREELVWYATPVALDWSLKPIKEWNQED
jgi:hypothetical protein